MTADYARDIEQHAEQLYAARSALSETKSPPRRLGVAEILQFLNEPQRSLTNEEQRSLFTDLRLRAAFRRLKSQMAAAELPALAAASVGEVSSRHFNGGTVNIFPSRVQGQRYVVLRFNWPSGTPRTMLLENTEGELVKRMLPAADTNGEIMIVLDEKNVTDAGFLRLISDPTATGSFLL